jgi:hypothetical protein
VFSVGFANERASAACFVAFRRFDLDDFCAVVAKELAEMWSCYSGCQLEYGNAV